MATKKHKPGTVVHLHVWDRGQICATCGERMSLSTVQENERIFHALIQKLEARLVRARERGMKRRLVSTSARNDGLEAAAVHCERTMVEVLMLVPDQIINDTLTAVANEIRGLKEKVHGAQPTNG